MVFSRIKGLDELLLEASRYPVDRKHDKDQKFAAQFEAWKWFIGEAKKLRDAYLSTRPYQTTRCLRKTDSSAQRGLCPIPQVVP